MSSRYKGVWIRYASGIAGTNVVVTKSLQVVVMHPAPIEGVSLQDVGSTVEVALIRP